MAIAGGDLTARAAPALAGRTDELASLAHDFDRMAERVQLLVEQQKLLLRDISHELRSPLARLTVSAGLVQRGDLAAAARMQSDIKTLETMISDLLTLARIDASDKHSRREPVHIGQLVQQIVKDASFEGAAETKTRRSNRRVRPLYFRGHGFTAQLYRECCSQRAETYATRPESWK